MSKKKTQLDKAIDTLVNQGLELRHKFESEAEGLNKAIATLREQQAAKPKRRSKLVPVEAKGA